MATLNCEQRLLLDSLTRKHGITQKGPDDKPPAIVDDGPGKPLSGREHEVLQLLADGLTNDQIAAALDLSKETVKTHVRHVLKKLDATGRAHAVAIGYRLEMLADEAP